MNDQAKILAKIELLKKKAATGDSHARAELEKLSRVVGMITRARQQQEQQAALQQQLMAHALAERIAGEEEDDDEGELTAQYTPDTLDFANKVAQRAYNADQLDRKVITRQEQWQSLNNQAPFMRVNPPSALKGTLGNQLTLRSGTDPVTGGVRQQDRRGQVVNWEGEDAETTPITVTLAPVSPPGGLAAGQFPPWMLPVGIIRFGTRGFSADFEVDIAQGCQFTLTAASVVVEVALNESLPGIVEPDASFQLAGMISFGTTNRQPCPVTRTLYGSLDTTGPTPVGDTSFNVPNFAKRFWIMVSDASPVPPAFRLTYRSGSFTPFVRDYAANYDQQTPFTIPNGTTEIEISFGAAVGSFLVGLIFELEF